jgi:hypothetical protein
MTDFQQGFAAGVEAAAKRAEDEEEPQGDCPVELPRTELRDIVVGSVRATKKAIAAGIRVLRPPATIPAPDPNFTAGVEAMRAALVEYFRVWPRDRMMADFISKFDIPSHFLRRPVAPAESEEKC